MLVVNRLLQQFNSQWQCFADFQEMCIIGRNCSETCIWIHFSPCHFLFLFTHSWSGMEIKSLGSSHLFLILLVYVDQKKPARLSYWPLRSCHMLSEVQNMQWRPSCPPPPGLKFFQFHAVFGKIWQNRMLAPHLGSWRPLLGEILDPRLTWVSMLTQIGLMSSKV